ncbi:hypothetical protein G5I_04052 [Acromyrmex echinatior]|uniref:Uncharacterized protein n=1 Tax=Acromyrmex echinatior TaxID=103372 RepID=F4WEP5_ACREC|nr:hypothetical protein G5I_04052 [Acromyrmex echinatior]
MWVFLSPKGVHKCVFAILLGLTRLISPPGAGNDVVVGGAEMIARTVPIAAFLDIVTTSHQSFDLDAINIWSELFALVCAPGNPLSASQVDSCRKVGGWTRQPLESPNPEESTKKPVITAVVVIAAGGAGLQS